jgi:hypothetical protein
MAETDPQLEIALEYFYGENYPAAMDELASILRRPSPPAAARHLSAQCEVLRDLKQALDAAGRETYTNELEALGVTLDDKRDQPWLEEAESEAVKRLVNRGLLLAERLLGRVDYPSMRKWLESLHKALPGYERVTEQYEACENLIKTVEASITWVPTAESDKILMNILDVKRQLNRLSEIIRQSPSDSGAMDRRKEQLVVYKGLLKERSQRVRTLQEQADLAIAEGRFREARNTLNELLYLSYIGHLPKGLREEVNRLELDFLQVDVPNVQAQLKQARDLAGFAEKAAALLDQAEDALTRLDFTGTRRLIEQVRKMELRGRPLSTEMALALRRLRTNALREGDDALIKEAEQLCQTSLVARLAALDDKVTSAWRLYEAAVQAENSDDFASARQKLSDLRAGWPGCGDEIDRRVRDIDRLRHIRDLLDEANRSGKFDKILDGYANNPCETEHGKAQMDKLRQKVMSAKQAYEFRQLAKKDENRFKHALALLETAKKTWRDEDFQEVFSYLDSEEGQAETPTGKGQLGQIRSRAALEQQQVASGRRTVSEQQEAENWAAEARVLLQANIRLGRALRLAKKAAARFPSNEEYQQSVADAIKAKAQAEAETKARQEQAAAKAAQRRQELLEHVRAAWAKLNLGELDDADKQIEAACELGPTQDETAEVLRALQITSEFISTTLRRARAAESLKFAPGDAETLGLSAEETIDPFAAFRSIIHAQRKALRAIREMRDLDRASECVKQFIETYPNHKDALSLQADISVVKTEQNHRAAIRDKEAGIEKHEADGQLDRAIQLLDDLLQAYETSTRKETWQARRMALGQVRRGDLEAARAALEKISRADAYTWGIIEQCQQNLAGGQQALERARRIKSGNETLIAPSELAEVFEKAESALNFVRTRMPGSSEVAEKWQQAFCGARVERVRYQLAGSPIPLVTVEQYDNLLERLQDVPDTYEDVTSLKHQIEDERDKLQKCYDRVHGAVAEAQSLQALGDLAGADDKFGEAAANFPEFVSTVDDIYKPDLWRQIERHIQQNNRWKNDLANADKALASETGLDEARRIMDQLEREIRRSLPESELEEFQAFVEKRTELYDIVSKMRQALAEAETLRHERKYTEARRILHQVSKTIPPATPNAELNSALNALYDAICDLRDRMSKWDADAGEATRRWEEAQALLNKDPAGKDQTGAPRNGRNLVRAIELLEQATNVDPDPKRSEIEETLTAARRHREQFEKLRNWLNDTRERLEIRVGGDDGTNYQETWESARAITKQVLDEPPSAEWPISPTQREEARTLYGEAKNRLERAEKLQDLLRQVQELLADYRPEEALKLLEDTPDPNNPILDSVRRQAQDLNERVRKVKQLLVTAQEFKDRRKKRQYLEALSQIDEVQEGRQIYDVLINRGSPLPLATVVASPGASTGFASEESFSSDNEPRE